MDADTTMTRHEEKEGHHTSFFSNNHAVMLLIDPETAAIVDANTAACRFYGYDQATLLSLNITDINILSPDEITQEMDRAVSEQRSHVHFRHKLANGDIRDVEVYSGPMTIQGKRVLYSIIHDITEQKKVEESLRLSEEALKRANSELEQRVAERTEELQRAHFALEHAAEGIFWLTADAHMVYTNQATCTLLGYSCAELQAMSLLHIESSLSQDFWNFRWLYIMQSKFATFETWFVRKDGTTFPVEVTANSMIFQGKEYMCAFARDITIRKKTEARLRQSEAALQQANAELEQRVEQQTAELRRNQFLLQSVLDNAPAAIYVKDIQGRFLLINRFTEQLLGKTQQEVIGKTGYDLFYEQYADIWQQHEQQVIATQQAIEREEIALLPNKVQHTFLSIRFPVYDDQGEIYATGGISTDITERKHMEEALRKNEEKYRLLAENMHDVVWTLTREGQFTYVSPSVYYLRGYTPEEVLQQTLPEALTPESLQRVTDAVAETLRSGEYRVDRMELEQPCKDGSSVWTECVTVPLLDDVQTLTGWVGVSRDISERKRSQEQLQRAKEAAEAANRAKSTFLANMSHELRTPLNAILGFTQLLVRDQRVLPEHGDYLRIIERSGEHLLSLINDILEMSRIEAGRTRLQEHAFDLHQLLHDLQDMFYLRAQKKGLQLGLKIAANVPNYVSADEGKLRQILINLLSNAIKFTPHGTVQLSCSAQPMQQAMVVDNQSSTAQEHRFLLHFAVADSGIGIAPDELSRIFDPFIQNRGSQQSQEGTGLGLPISQHFAQIMGSELLVESTPSQGSTFFFDLHVREVTGDDISAGSSRPQAICLAPGQTLYRVLVVEDQQESRELLVELLTSFGFAVQSAMHGQQGLELCEQWQPHVIFMDMRMPVMDGYEATQRIKSTNQGNSTFIVALTASVFAEQREDILAAGCDEFMHKPFRQEELVAVLVKLLGVEFVYKKPEHSTQKPQDGYGASDAAEVVPSALTMETLELLPIELVAEFHHAAILGNVKMLHDMIEVIREYQSELADELLYLVEMFRFDQITAVTGMLIDEEG
jgi:PAS domain S-box-containing protein